MFLTPRSREGKSSRCPCLSFFRSVNFSLPFKHVNSDNPRTAHDLWASARGETVQQPGIAKINTSVYVYISKDAKRDPIDNYQAGFLKFHFPLLPLRFFSHT